MRNNTAGEIIQIKDWEKNFESAKSKTYKTCTHVYMPNCQTGDGLTYILCQPDGAAIFGLWCLLVEACSMQESPRQGYCTDTGMINGSQWTVTVLARRWRRTEQEIQRMFDVILCPEVSWATKHTLKDTTRILQGYQTDTTRIPDGYHTDTKIHSNLNSNLNLNILTTVPSAEPEKQINQTATETEKTADDANWIDWDRVADAWRADEFPERDLRWILKAIRGDFQKHGWALPDNFQRDLVAVGLTAKQRLAGGQRINIGAYVVSWVRDAVRDRRPPWTPPDGLLRKAASLLQEYRKAGAPTTPAHDLQLGAIKSG